MLAGGVWVMRTSTSTGIFAHSYPKTTHDGFTQTCPETVLYQQYKSTKMASYNNSKSPQRKIMIQTLIFYFQPFNFQAVSIAVHLTFKSIPPSKSPRPKHGFHHPSPQAVRENSPGVAPPLTPFLAWLNPTKVGFDLTLFTTDHIFGIIPHLRDIMTITQIR